jgi:hypothetical protein
VYVNAKESMVIISASTWLFLANDLTKEAKSGSTGLEAWRCSSGGPLARQPIYTHTKADVMWEARAIFFHILLGWLNIRKASDA